MNRISFRLLTIVTIFSMLITMPQMTVSAGNTINVPGDYSTIQEAVNAAAAGDVIQVAAGTYSVPDRIDLNKPNLTLSGAGSTSTFVQVSGTGERFYITAPGVTINGFGIQKTDKIGVQNIIYIGANDVSITNNEISGQFVIGDGDVSRAMVFAGGLSGLNISGNIIHDIRQPGYISGVTTGTISNNYVYLTKGWVVEQGNMTFINNTWGTGANSNVYDIAILSTVDAGYYTDIPAMAAANNGAFIEDQRPASPTLSIVYVDGSVAVSGDGTARSPKKTILEGVARVVSGGTIHIAAGTYAENVVIDKSLIMTGAGQGNTIIQPAVSNPNPCSNSSLCGGAASNVFLVQSDNVVIHDLTVDGDNPALTSGIVRTGGGAPADLDARNGIIKNTTATYNGLEVYNVTVQNIYLRGIYSTNGSFNFHHNSVTNVQGDTGSIAMFAWGGPGTMANNTVSYANDGIAANHSNGIQFLNNTVTHSGSGVHTDNSGDGGGVADLIQGNTVSDCSTGGYGVWTFVPYLAPVIENNTITNCAVGLSAWGQGAPVTHQFINNTVNGPARETGSVGVYITTDLISWGYTDISVNFTGNVITNNETGVYMTADPQSWNPDPYEAKTITATFHENQIFGNTYGVDKGTGGTIINDFINNWWGSATGPLAPDNPTGTGDSVVSGINYSPWCQNADCTSEEPPLLPSSFFGEIHINDGAPNVGDTLEAYLPDVPGVAASTTITTYLGNLVYSLDIPGTGATEGDTITFKINGRVVATSIWHSGTHTELNIHPPQALPGGPYEGDAGAAIHFTGAANDWGNDAAAYQWDFDGDGSYETTGQDVDHTWMDFGTYTVGLRVTDAQGGVGTATVTVTVNKVNATVTLGNLSQTYDGNPKPITVTTDPAGLNVDVTYDGSGTPPTDAGSYAVVATVTTPNYQGSASGTLVISKADTMTVVSGGGTFVYDGASHPATVSVTGAGGLNLTPSPVYSGSCSAAPVNVNDTPCTASYTYSGDANHNGSTGSTTIIIAPKPVTVTADAGQSKVFGSADPIFTYTSDPLIGGDGFTGALSRVGGENVGTYPITIGTLSAGDNYVLTLVSSDFAITPASATLTLGNLSQVYDGLPKPVTVTTEPAGLAYSVTYDGSTTVPVNPGSYAVVATITDPNYTGTTSGTLVILGIHDIALVPGWNLVSFNIHPTNTNIASVLSSISGNFDLVYAWDATGASAGSGNWLKYDNIPYSPDSLTVLDETMGFWIHMTVADTLEVVGTVPTTTNVPLLDNAGGWNLVAYPSAGNGSLPDILSDHGVGNDFTLVYAYHANETVDPWKLFDRTAPIFSNDLAQLTPGWGYWIKVSADHTWVIVNVP